MKRWIVLEPPTSADAARGTFSEPSLAPRSARAVFVRDGFSVFALLLPVFWLWRHGLILSGLIVLALLVALALLSGIDGLGAAVTLLPLLLGVLTALEGPSLRVARYIRRGYDEVAIVHARDVSDAEILYYAGEASWTPEPAREAGVASRLWPRRPRASTSLLGPIGTH